MKVYRLDPDNDRFHNFALAEESEAVVYDRFNGTELKSEWRPLEIMAVDTDEELAQFGDFAMLGTIPVFSERAAVALANVLETNGELLPLSHRGTQYFAYNVTTVVEALDGERAKVRRFSTGRIMTVEQFAFRLECLHGLMIFKIPELLRGYVFVTDAFVDRIAKEGLQGFQFQEIWSGVPT